MASCHPERREAVTNVTNDTAGAKLNQALQIVSKNLCELEPDGMGA